jgi:tetratricopeptide (TPR) repeat protein
MEKQLPKINPTSGRYRMRMTQSDADSGSTLKAPFRVAGKLVLTSCIALAGGVALAGATAAEEMTQSEVAATGLAGIHDNRAINGDPPNPLRASEKLADYRDAIAQLEAEQGAWGLGLAEQLAGLGQTYQTRGQHRDAIKIFDRAIHVSRINNGLYDLSQVPIIERMVESLKARGRWEEVHERHQYLFWLHKRNFGADDPRMLPVIDRLGKWYINDYALNPERRMMDQLVDAHNLFQHAVNIISGTYGENDLRLIEPLRGLVMSNWFFANYRGEGGTTPLERSHLTRELGVDQVNFLTDQHTDNRLTQYLRNNYADGKRAIEQMVAIYSVSPDARPGAAARAKVELADWEQLFDRRRNAADLYRQAYVELKADEKTRTQAEKLFSQPVALPELEFVESDLEQPASVRGATDNEAIEPVNYVLVSFDVNRFGDAENIQVLESSPEDNADYRARVKRSLETTRFRPRLVDGEPVDTQGLTQKFVFTSE